MNSNLKCDDDLAVSIPPQHKHHVLFIHALASGTSTLVSCCSCIATASARIHATRAVFSCSLTSYMLSLVVDRDQAKGVWWITVLVDPASMTPLTPQSRRRFSFESARSHVLWLHARLVFRAQVLGSASMTNAAKQNASRDRRRFARSTTATQEIVKETSRTKRTEIARCENVGA